MAGPLTAQAPLDKLQAELNNVLFQVGKIFKHAHSGEMKALHQAKVKATKGIPEANTNFHEALDELERDLFAARNVVIRDLSALRQKRAAREKADGAARLRASNKGPTKVNGMSATSSGIEQPIKAEPEQVNPKPSQVSTAPAISVTRGQANVAAAAAIEQAPAPPLEQAALAPSMDFDTDLDSMFDDSFDDVPTAEDAASMPQSVEKIAQSKTNMGPAAGDGGTADASISTDALFSGDDITFEGTEFTNMATNGSEDDIQCILPGLEKYVNQGQDNPASNLGSQNVPGEAEDFDLEALLDDVSGDGGDSKMTADGTAKSRAPSGQQDKASNAMSEAPKKDGNETTGAVGDGGSIDLNDTNTHFDINFDDLTGDVGDGGSMAMNENMDDWFNFD